MRISISADNQIPIEELIDKILEKAGLKKSSAASDRDGNKPSAPLAKDGQSASSAKESAVYHDEPILRPASSLPNYTPPIYRKMRQIAKSYDAYCRSEEWLFYTQGKLMENVTDDFSYHGNLSRYYPTYQSMTDQQLRGYFTWRTKVRAGQIEKANDGFSHVYMYELINQIGVTDPQDGFDKLYAFWQSYRVFDETLDYFVPRWLTDFVIYYQLDVTCLQKLSNMDFTENLSVLQQCAAKDDDALFAALCALSTYRIDRSRLYKQEPALFKAALCGCFRALSQYFEKKRKNTLCEKLFGRMATEGYYPFASSVFYEPKPHADAEYIVNSLQSFCCVNGRWTRSGFLGYSGPSVELGRIVKAVDALLREKIGFPYPLKNELTTKVTLQILQKEIDKTVSPPKPPEPPKPAVRKVTFDLSKLSSIRQAAESTREKLIVDGDENSEEAFSPPPVPSPALPPKEPVAAPAPVEASDSLTEHELYLLRCLLRSEPYEDYLRQNALLLSVLVDGINDKLYDTFGDTVADFTDDAPVLLADYVDELKGTFL